jgi:hypothetical protein
MVSRLGSTQPAGNSAADFPAEAPLADGPAFDPTLPFPDGAGLDCVSPQPVNPAAVSSKHSTDCPTIIPVRFRSMVLPREGNFNSAAFPTESASAAEW